MNSSNQKIRLEDIITILEEKLGNGACVTFSPEGVSMLPLIRPGRDSVTLSKEAKPKVGDAVFYKRPNGQFVLHRIVQMEDGDFVLSGDNQLLLEKGVKSDWIIATVTSVYRGKKTLKRESKKMAVYLKVILPCYKSYLKTRSVLGKLKRKIKGNH